MDWHGNERDAVLTAHDEPGGRVVSSREGTTREAYGPGAGVRGHLHVPRPIEPETVRRQRRYADHGAGVAFKLRTQL